MCLEQLLYCSDYCIQAHKLVVWRVAETNKTCFRENGLLFGCCDRHQLDHTSTLGGRSLVEISTKRRHPQCLSLVEGWCRSLADILSTLQCVSLIYQANFDQTSTLGVSKFGHSLVEVWSKFRHLGVEVLSKFRPNFDTRIVQNLLCYANNYTILSNHIDYVVQQPFTQIVYLCWNLTIYVLYKTK